MGLPGDRLRFTLQRGVETGSISARGNITPTEYRVDLEREYDVYLQQAGSREFVGGCSVEAGGDGTHVVLPALDISFDPPDCDFWGVWNTDDDGFARLRHVWMTFQGA